MIDLDMAPASKRRRVSGAHLRAAREARGLSQEDLAARLDVRGPTVSERENSDRSPTRKGPGVSWEVWLAWASALGLPSTWRPGDPVPPEEEPS